MTRNELDMTLERALTALDAEARDHHHDPHPWVRDEVKSAHTACRRCGQTMVVRVYPDSHTFKSGLKDECPSFGRQPNGQTWLGGQTVNFGEATRRLLHGAQ